MSIYVDIEKRLGSFHLNATFEAGNDTLALLGASGCGKSMTLKCIAGIEKPDKGKIILDGVTLFDSEKNINLPPQKRHVGLMFQNYALFPNMTVLQNICVAAKREKDTAKRKIDIDHVMSSFGLNELSSYYPHQLSGGQQQRVALARILVSNPNIMLLDEPFSSLDNHLRFQLEQSVRDVIRTFNKSVILVSHDRDEVYRMANQIAVMNNGQIEAYGNKKAVFDRPRTKTSATLTGCKNISAIKRLNENRIFAIDWGLELSVQGSFSNAAFVGIRMHYLRPGNGENSVLCRVVEEIENPFSYVIMLRPEGADCTVPIGFETDKATWESMRDETISISLPKDFLIPLE